MPRKLLRRWLPHPARLRSERSLQIFGRLLRNREIWSVHRRSVARAGAIGLFMAFVPFPSQMVLAAAAAIWLGCNLPVAIVMVWLTNPITIPVIFYGAYRCGSWLLNRPPRQIDFELSFGWLSNQVADIWAPLLLGCFVLGTLAAIIGYVGINLLWRLHVVRSWRERRAAKRATAKRRPARSSPRPTQD